MKMKKVLKGLALGAVISLVAVTGAQAGLKEVNMFGASAQFDFWSAAGPAYLQAQGCSTGNIVSLQKKGQTIAPFDKRDYFIAVCKGDTAAAGQAAVSGGGIGANHDTVVIRYTTYASGQGVKAAMNDDTDVQECTASGAGYRGMIDTFSGSSISTVGCKEVHGGASDVAAETFEFDSHGEESGPCSVNKWKDEEVRDLTANPEFSNLLPAYKPLIVPFAFFANAQFPFNNISRAQAFLVFTGQVDNWNFFKPDLNGDGQITADAYPAGDDLPVRVCMRHASSGTQATMLASIIRREAIIDGFENPYSAPFKYFNKGSSEVVACLKGCGTDYADFGGAIGVIDADKDIAAATSLTEDGLTSGDGKMKRLSYNGYTAIEPNIKNGNYDFWSAQHLYQHKDDSQVAKDLVASLVAFASSPANLETYMPAKAAFWAAQDEMNVAKDNDFAMPKKK